MKHLTSLTAAALLAAAAATPALTQEKGDFTIGLGVAGVLPQDNNGVLDGPTPIDIDDNVRPIVTLEYFPVDRIGIELLASWPFEHDIDSGGTNIGEIKHLPPTLSVQYHFTNPSRFTPFAGVGVNYLHTFDEKAKGPLAGQDLELDDSWGVAFHAGLDFAINDKGALRADVRWIDVDNDVKLNGNEIGEAEIDPWVVGLSYVFKF